MKDLEIKLPRSGIVHRLDRDTSGVMVIAKTEKALIDLQNQFASHKVVKTYYALVFGKLEPKEGTIKIALKRDPRNRIRFIAIKAKDAREASKKYKVIQYLIPRFNFRHTPNELWDMSAKAGSSFLRMILKLVGHTR